MILTIEGGKLVLKTNSLENISEAHIIVQIPAHISNGKRIKLFLNDNALEEITQNVYKINVGYFETVENKIKVILYTPTNIETFETYFDTQVYFSLGKQGHEKLPQAFQDVFKKINELENRILELEKEKNVL